MVKNYSLVLNIVLKKVLPKETDELRLKNWAKKALEQAKVLGKEYNAIPILAGSITRDTWLPGKFEFDIFVQFPETFPEKQFESAGLQIGKKLITKLGGKFEIRYAQHPYVSGKVDGIQIDVVPCYHVGSPEKMRSAVDRTPFHVKYIEENINKTLSNEVRLLKQFCLANDIYGADTKTEGFSGYVCELMVIKYKNFLNVLKNCLSWRPGEVLDLKNFYKKEDYGKLRKQFKNHPLILIDPTDKERNTCAALSPKNFFKLKKLATDFLLKPNESFFFGKKLQPLTENELMINQKKRITEIILIVFRPPKIVPDILWPQLRRFGERLQSILEESRNEFKVLGRDVYSNEKEIAVVLLEMEVSKLPKVQKRIGPSVFDLNDSANFLKKYSKDLIAGPYIENSNWVVEVERKFLSAREKLKDSLKRKSETLKEKGIPNFIAEEISKKFEIVSENRDIMKMIRTNERFGDFLRKYFEKESLA